MWSKVSYLRNQYDSRDWASNHRPSGLKSDALTNTPLRPQGREGNKANYTRIVWTLFTGSTFIFSGLVKCSPSTLL